MNEQPCPACGRPTARQLAEASELGSVNYHICDVCDHVWTTDKDTGAILKQVPMSRPTRPPSD
jgi:hypothetical protein